MIRVVAAIMVRGNEILICQRTRHQSKPLKWEFPGGKIELGEQPRDALRRELEEELGIRADVGDEVERITHTYEDGGVVELRFYVVRGFEGELENRIFREILWENRTKLPDYDFLEADLPVVTNIAAGKLV
jgi:8-oxo-dGTP diphosphatase